MQNMLGAFPNMVDGYGIYQKGKQAQGNRLAALAFNAQGADRESALGKLAGIDPNQAYRLKTDFDEQDKIGLSEGSRYLLAAPDAVKPQVYASLVQRYGHKFRAQGIEPPQDYREAMPFFEQLAQSAGGGLRVHSQYMGDDGNVRVVMNDGSEKALGKYSPKYTPHFDAYGNVTGFNPRTNELTPTTVGGNQPSAEVQLTAPDGESIDYNSMSPDDQAAYRLMLQNPGVGQTVRVQNGQVISSTMGGQQARVGVKPDAPKDAPSGYQYNQDGSLSPIKGGPADPAVAKPTKPWTPAGLAKYNEVRTDVQVATTLNTMMDDMGALFNDPNFDLGPVQNKVYEAQNWSGKSTPQSRAYAKLRSNFEKMRNDSLRLNKGVQTDGDAQRAWAEIFQNMNDKELVKDRLADIKRYNEFALNEKRLQVENFEAEFGKPGAARQNQPPAAPAGEPQRIRIKL